MSKTRVYLGPEELALVATTFVKNYGQNMPSPALLTEAIKVLEPERRIRVGGIPSQAPSMTSVLVYMIHILQGRAERNNRFSFEITGRYRWLLDEAFKIANAEPPKVIPPPIPDPVSEPNPEPDLARIPTHELTAELFARREFSTSTILAELKLIRKDIEGLFDLIAEAIDKRKEPVNQVTLVPSTADVELIRDAITNRTDVAPKRRVLLFTNKSSQISHYEAQLSNLRIKIFASGNVSQSEMGSSADAVIILAKFTNHSISKNAKEFATRVGAKYFEIHGTNQLEQLLRAMNKNFYSVI